MNTTVVALLVAAAIAAATNWWSRATSSVRTEEWTKPAVTVLVLLSAAATDAESGAAKAVIVLALLACLLGDIALLGRFDRFEIGLGSFLLAHLLFGAAALIGGIDARVAALAVLPLVVLVGLVGRRIIGSSGPLGPAVALYLGVIAAMFVVVCGTRSIPAAVAAALFVVSDSVLGWDRFVARLRSAPLVVMVTYHLAIVGLALALQLDTLTSSAPVG